MSNDLNTRARRLDDLERQNRRLRLILVAAVVVLAAVGAKGPVLELIDESGRRATTSEDPARAR